MKRKMYFLMTIFLLLCITFSCSMKQAGFDAQEKSEKKLNELGGGRTDDGYLLRETNKSYYNLLNYLSSPIEINTHGKSKVYEVSLLQNNAQVYSILYDYYGVGETGQRVAVSSHNNIKKLNIIGVNSKTGEEKLIYSGKPTSRPCSINFSTYFIVDKLKFQVLDTVNRIVFKVLEVNNYIYPTEMFFEQGETFEMYEGDTIDLSLFTWLTFFGYDRYSYSTTSENIDMLLTDNSRRIVVSAKKESDRNYIYCESINKLYASISIKIIPRPQILNEDFNMKTWKYRNGLFHSSFRYLKGDYDGDGKVDIAVAYNDGGYSSIAVYKSNGNGFDNYVDWKKRNGLFMNTHRWLSGDYDGDGRDDIAVAYSDGGYSSIAVYKSNRNGFDNYVDWKKRNGLFMNAYKWLSGDFNGDEKDDIITVYDDRGYSSVAYCLSSGNNFSYYYDWKTQYPFYSYSPWLFGNFNGSHRRDDFCSILNDSGYVSICVATNK